MLGEGFVGAWDLGRFIWGGFGQGTDGLGVVKGEDRGGVEGPEAGGGRDLSLDGSWIAPAVFGEGREVNFADIEW